MIFNPLESRSNKIEIEASCINPGDAPGAMSSVLQERIAAIAQNVVRARKNGRPVILSFGAHTIKNGLAPVLAALIEEGWVSHLATNGAGVIHDWEFAFQGQSSEDVRENVRTGRFGTWEETGFFINLAIMNGAYRGLGYGEAVGSLISTGKIEIPPEGELLACMRSAGTDAGNAVPLWKVAAAADYMELIQAENLTPGRLDVKHPYSRFSIQARAFENGTPFTSHPMFGHDIIYTHRANRGAAIGRCAERDFLCFVQSVSDLEGGVYLSLGSAVMSPMIFEKSLSMARNVAIQNGKEIRDCAIHVVDLQEETWDWSRGEPPADNPAYYLRFMKTFNRMGCPVDYTSMDNRDFLLELYTQCKSSSQPG